MKSAAAQYFSRKTTRKHVAAKAATRELVRSIVAAAPTSEQQQRADELARKARAAKTADFLVAYRVTA